MTDPFAATPPTAPPTGILTPEVPTTRPDERIAAGPIEQDLAAIDAAMARLDAGTYGTCEVCHDALDDGVLEADPVARFCTGHLPGTVS